MRRRRSHIETAVRSGRVGDVQDMRILQCFLEWAVAHTALWVPWLVWTVPAARMKAGREHRVPLPQRALKIAKAMHEARNGDFVFPGQRPGKPLSAMALEMVLRRMKIENATVHGFRSTFRDWAADSTHFANEVCEAALAHVIENKAEAAYRRGDLFDKRRKLMEAWAAYCAALVEQ